MAITRIRWSIAMLDELLERLGNIPPHRICRVHPARANGERRHSIQDRTNGNFELVEGRLWRSLLSQLESFTHHRISPFFLRSLAARQFHRLSDRSRRRDACLEKLIRMPDISFISWDQLPTRERQHRVIRPVSPALAVEVLSKRNTAQDDAAQAEGILPRRYATRMDVDPPTRTVEVWTRRRLHNADGGTVTRWR